MDYEPNWKPPTDPPRVDISFAIVDEAIRVVSEGIPDLLESVPVRNSFNTKIRLENGWIGLVVEFSHAPGIPSIGDDLEPEAVLAFQAASELTLIGSHQELRVALGSQYFSFSKFSYVGPYRDGKLSWPHLATHLMAWLNDIVLPEVLRRNQTRVLRAIPRPPQVDIGHISKALWVLECEDSIRQGTGFFLKGTGLVTCDHVLGPQTRAFQANMPSDRRCVSVTSREPAIDLAVLEMEGVKEGGLESGSPDQLKQMDHLIICGYPNYRLGDSGTMVPGLVVGFRKVAGIRRILTNAPIVGGTSGGPVIDASGKVIGVAVTGSDRMESAQATEDHGIIPIDALGFLQRSG